MRRRGTRRWIGAAVTAVLFAAVPGSAEVRWPWETPKKTDKDKQEKVEPVPTAPGPRTERTPEYSGDAQDREMLPRLARYYRGQLDLSDRAMTSAPNDEVRSLAGRLNRNAERALGVIHERARAIGLNLEPHVRASLTDRLRRQAGGRPAARDRWEKQEEIAFLQEAMTNIREVRADFASYKAQNADRRFHQELRQLFDDELVPIYDEAKQLHDRIRNEARNQ